MNRRMRKKKQKQQVVRMQLEREPDKIKELEKTTVSGEDFVKTDICATSKTCEKELCDFGQDENVKDKNVHARKGKQHKTIEKQWMKNMWFPMALLFMEIVMACSTGGQIFSRYGIYITLFSLSYGWILYLLTTMTKWKWLNRFLQGLVLGSTAFIYCMIYFLFCEFRVFYDFDTMFAGAGDAIGDFTGDILSLIVTADGILHIVLFFLPFFIYQVMGKRWDIERTSIREKGILLCSGILMFGINVGYIKLHEVDNGVYAKEYHYDTAITDFGLLTGIRLEIQNRMWSNSKDTSFEVVEWDEDETDFMLETTETTECLTEKEKEDAVVKEQKPLEYNALEIDFEILSKEESGKYAAIDEYVATLKPSLKNKYTGLFKGKNLIFISAEAFTAEVIDRQLTPTLYRLANKGIQFTDYYQPSGAGTTGGEYCNIFGMLPTAGGSSVKNTANHLNWTTISARLNEEGYYGKAYHNNDYTYYDRHKTHTNLGYSDGFEGVGNGLESIITSQWPESDLEMMEGTIPTYIQKQPFQIYYMTVSGHSLYSTGKNAMTKKHWEQVKDLPYSDPVKAYYGCQLELEDALTYLVDQLEQQGIAEDTVIVMGADHFPYGLDQNSSTFTYLSELYGRKIDNDFVRDHNRLIIWSGCLEQEPPILVDTPTSSLDILPTLCNLFGVEYDSRLLVGRDVFSNEKPLVFTLGYDWKTEKGTYLAAKGKFIPVDGRVEVSEEYIDTIKTIVQNKMNYSKNVLKLDYFRHIFGEK